MDALNTKTYDVAVHTDEKTLSPMFTVTDSNSNTVLVATFVLDRQGPRMDITTPDSAEPIGTISTTDQKETIILFRGQRYVLRREGLIKKKYMFVTMDGQELSWSHHLTGLNCVDVHGRKRAKARDGGMSGYGKHIIEIDAELGVEVLLTAVAMFTIGRKNRGGVPDVMASSFMILGPLTLN